MSHRLRRGSVLGLLVLALAGALTGALVTPASAAPVPADWTLTNPDIPDPNCVSAQTTFNVKQVSCLFKSQGIMQGYSKIDFQPLFGSANVTSCSVFLQLKSSYGTLTPESQTRTWDCFTIAKQGGTLWANTPAFWRNWGSGRQAGDSYTQYMWIEVTTPGHTYNSRSTPARRTITI